jgi:Ssp1 endopeptidase immunity protein Rap1a
VHRIYGGSSGWCAGGRWVSETDYRQNPDCPFCVPDAADNEQMIRITLKYIRNNPEEAHKTTAVLIVEAVRVAFPCVAHTAKKK